MDDILKRIYIARSAEISAFSLVPSREMDVIEKEEMSATLPMSELSIENASTELKPPSGDVSDQKPQSMCLIVLGMAGSGKTTFVQRLTALLTSQDTPPYVVNLDPACHQLPFPCNIDIRDTVKYQEVKKSYNLGPNGAIVTSLNLFATKFDQVVSLIEQKRSQHKYIIFDTPGQMEVFTWSASGTIITETLASQFPTIIVYVMDIERSTNTATFMSNMLHACSIMYKSRLPLLVVMNKTDVKNSDYAITWMRDFEKFDDALSQETSYISNLHRSMSLVLDEFYENLSVVSVSSLTGGGFENLNAAFEEKYKEYVVDYKPEYDRLKRENEKAKRDKERKLLEKYSRAAGDEVKMDVNADVPGRGRVFLGEDDSEPESMDDDDDEKQKELEEGSFRDFLARKSVK